MKLNLMLPKVVMMVFLRGYNILSLFHFVGKRQFLVDQVGRIVKENFDLHL